MSLHNVQSVSNSFDQDFGNPDHHLVGADHHTALTHPHEVAHLTHHHVMGSYDHSNDFLDYQDPLKHAYKHQFQPFSLDLSNTHFVHPHHVNGYFRSDGTYVNGYFRDGDGNTAIDHTAEQGGGYISSNPDGNPFNNLKF